MNAGDAPDFVHGIVVSLFLLEASFGVVQVTTMNDPHDSLRREYAYCLLSFTSKQILSWVVWSGFKQRP